MFAEDPSTALEKHLGDLVLSPTYIIKQCERDENNFQKVTYILDTLERCAQLFSEPKIKLLFVG